jgi:hypothetical protein
MCARNDTVKTIWAFNAYFQKNIKYGAASCDFNGNGILEWPRTSPCIPSQAAKSLAHPHWCVPAKNATNDALQSGLSFVCGPGGLDCSLIQPGGQCVYPAENVLRGKCGWAYDAYYQSEVRGGDIAAWACKFDGAGELITPPCGEYNHGNPKTGRGYAYPDAAYCKDPSSPRCGCIQNGTEFTQCRSCVGSNPQGCEVVCPWFQFDDVYI